MYKTKQKRKKRKSKTRKRLSGINKCATCMKSGRDVRLALETRNLISSIKKSPFHSLSIVGYEILKLPNFKKQKKYIDRLEKQLCKYVKKIQYIC